MIEFAVAMLKPETSFSPPTTEILPAVIKANKLRKIATKAEADAVAAEAEAARIAAF
tara:strand:+ start:458 stop:628 length:171 start_codon:yes stop_codon:yes gene_type:complete